ncbi:hypothetical protein EMIT0P176_730002 [Pseudomonas sp. IT-P176]
MDQDQKPEHGDLTVGLSGKGGRGGLPAGLFFLVGLKLLCRSELARDGGGSVDIDCD